jgi:ketosteroid isomerase-like protein
MPVFRTAAFAAIAALALAGCNVTAETKVDTAKIAETIKADVTKAVAGFNAKDVAAATAIDAENYVSMFHGMPNAVGKAADVKITQEQMAGSETNLQVSDQTVDVAASGDLAVVRMKYSFTYLDPATQKSATEVGNWLLGFRKQADGSMKAEWGVVSDTGKPAAAAK